MTATVTVLDLDHLVGTRGERTRATVQALRAYRGLTEQDIADRIGWKRSTVGSYCAGPTKFTDEAFAAFGYALGVPEFVLLMDRDEALRWVLDHPTDPRTPDGLEVSRRACNGGEIINLRARRSRTATPLSIAA